MGSWHRTNLNEIKNSKSLPVHLFVDDGGVLNDNSRRAHEWLRLIGEFMPARLGGTAEQWRTANRVVFPQVWGTLLKQLPEFVSHREFQREYATRWMNAMCIAVGITPLSEDNASALNQELSVYVNQRAEAAITGAVDAVRSLHRAGYTLYTASGTPSWDLRAVMAKMGIADVFSEFYGPDLIDHVKYGQAFYQKLFEDTGVDPSDAMVIESDSKYCRWATEAGANAVWIDSEGRGDATSLKSLADRLI